MSTHRPAIDVGISAFADFLFEPSEGLGGDEVQKSFGDGPDSAEIENPVQNVFDAAAQNRFGTNPSHVSAEAQARDSKFRKRFDATPADSPDSKTFQKRAKTRIEKTIFPLAGTAVCAEIDNATGAVIRTYVEAL